MTAKEGSRCARCPNPAALVMLATGKGPKMGHYPERQELCARCVVDEARIADRMGYVPIGESLEARR